MLIKKLTLTNFRAYTQAEFEFKDGLNLLVGINGVGKTTVLEALRVCLSVIYPNITETKHQKENFKESDIKIGADYLQVSCDFTYLDTNYNLLIVKRKETKVIIETPDKRDEIREVPDQEMFTPSIKLTTKKIRDLGLNPIAVFFSTKRSLITEKAPSKTAAQGGVAAAYVDTLSENREFNLKIFANWYKAQEQLAEENEIIRSNIKVFNQALETFLPAFKNLRIEEINEAPQFIIDKNGVPLNLHQLSDGERGVLSMVLDIAKRLSQANPLSAIPLLEGKGVILIDELDLHLHPKWQRSIVSNLIRVFPNCQFIATTHSPQIIPSLEPERIQIINIGEVYHPDRSLGMDTNWILKYLMESDDRPENAEQAIVEIEQLIADIEFDKARSAMAAYKQNGLDLPEWSVFEARIARLEIIDDEE